MRQALRGWFFRVWAVALVAALAYVGWAVSGGRSPVSLPVAEAGGVFGQMRPGYIYTTNEAGNVLFVWPVLGQASSAHIERWSFEDGTVTFKPISAYTPIAPGQVAPVPLQPGVPLQPFQPQPLPPAPQPGGGR